jgi:hypothetical protein
VREFVIPRPAASSPARLILRPDESRSTELAILLCAVCRFLAAYKDAAFVFRTAAIFAPVEEVIKAGYQS